jgi:hypothetical protein
MSAEFNVRFLRRFQRLLDEGDFSATYKFALLRALADLSVEKPTDPGGTLTISVREIAEKFIEYYWRQARPYHQSLLYQSGKGQAEVITKIVGHQHAVTQNLAEAKADPVRWERLVRKVAITRCSSRCSSRPGSSASSASGPTAKCSPIPAGSANSSSVPSDRGWTTTGKCCWRSTAPHASTARGS